jgi:outer membrane lipoprotein SlyB
MYYGDISREYNMRKQLLTALAASILALAFTISSASAQGTVRVRGTIEKVEGNAFVVKSRDGRELKVVPADNALVVAIVKASPADIKQGSFVGVTGMPQADGSQRAIEVHIFPEAMRGTGEGHYAWDLRPQSTMTNANVEHAVTAVDGQTLTLKYKDGEKKIIVPPEATVVTYTTGDKSELKPGTKIFVAAAKNLPDGSLEAPRINYGEDGLTPPM